MRSNLFIVSGFKFQKSVDFMPTMKYTHARLEEQQQSTCKLPQFVLCSYRVLLPLINHLNHQLKIKFNKRSLINSLISIKDNVDVVQQPSISTQNRVEHSVEKSIQQLKDIKYVHATTTNRSRISNYKSGYFNETHEKVTGELKLNSSQFKSKGFLSDAEKKLGNSKNLKSIDRSLSKLHEHSTKNWSLKDIDVSFYTSPSNFDRVYNRAYLPVKDISLNSMLNDVLSGPKRAKPSDMRSQQVAQISQMIRDNKEREMLKSPHQYSKTPSVFNPFQVSNYNTKRNEMKELVQAINVEQKNLYKALKDKVKNYHHKESPVTFTSLISSGKAFHANVQTIDSEGKGNGSSPATRFSPAGNQSAQYDIINPGKEQYAPLHSELFSPTGRIVPNKMSNISAIVDKANINGAHVSESFQQAFTNNPSIFRRKGHKFD